MERWQSASSLLRKRPSLPPRSMPSRMLLLLVAMLLLVVAMYPAAVDAQACAHYKQDALLDRLDSRLALCMDEQLHREALESVKESFAINEYDQQHPLALVAFSNSSRTLESFAGAITSSLFGETPALRQSVQVLDFAQLLPLQLLASTTHEVKQALRAALAKSLGACPERTLFILENVQVLDDATLPVLDTFLDPLNGKRAQFQQQQPGGSSKLLDSTHSVFLFLYQVERAAFEHTALQNGGGGDRKLSPHAAWRDFLMAKWTRREGLAEEFTPQAFVGRLTQSVTLFASDDGSSDAGASERTTGSKQHKQQCFAHKYSGEDSDEPADSTAAAAHDQLVKYISWALLPGLALLYRGKLWTQETAVRRAKRGPIKSAKKSAKKAKRAGKKAKKKY